MMTEDETAPQRVIGGVDTHKDVHVAAVLDELGRLHDTATFATTTAGYRSLYRWLCGHGEVLAVGVEGTGSWDAGLSRFLRARGVNVVEVNRTNRQTRRRKGKTDTVDAEAAARAVLSGDATVVPKAGAGPIESVRQLRVARAGAMKARTRRRTRCTASPTPHPTNSRPNCAGSPPCNALACAPGSASPIR